MIKNLHKNAFLEFRKGTALVYGLIIMSAVLILLTSILRYVGTQISYSANRLERERAFQIAESGIYYYRWYLAHATDGMNAQQLSAFWGDSATLGVSGPVEMEYRDPETNDVIGRYSLELAAPDPYSTIATVTVTGWTNKMPSVQRKIRARFRRASWSEYAVLADEFMRFGEGTEVYGKIHSNKGIRFDGLAHNSVTSLVEGFDDPDHNESGVDKDEFGVHTHVIAPPGSGVNDSFRSAEAPPNSVPNRPDVFAGGRQFPVPEVSFTGVQSDLSFMKQTACNDTGSGCAVVNNCWASGCYYDNSGYGRRIVLKTNGTFDMYLVNAYSATTNSITSFVGRRSTNGSACVTAVTSAGPNAQCQNNGTCLCNPINKTIPNNGIIYVDDSIWLEGSLGSGEYRVTVVAGEGTAFLGNNDITYSAYNGSNILGIIGKQDVEIIRNSQTDLQIDGALLAQNGRVGRQYYDGIHKSVITVNGALATKMRYGFAYVDGTGYTDRNLNFDNNLLYYPPPYFPTGTEYSIDLWQEL